MAKLILRATCVGIATLVLAAFIALSLAAMNTPSQFGEQEVGWDFTTGRPQLTLWAWLVLPAAFAIGFGIGYRYFSKRASKQAS